MNERSREATYISETIAENLASDFLASDLSSNIFIGSDIEQILAEHASLIYQDIDDGTYAGASIRYKGQSFIALNTHQSLRARYYSAAHELWHLGIDSALFENSKYKQLAQSPHFDSERAADHFAAAIMLPKEAVTLAWYNYVKKPSKRDESAAQEAVVRIANLSAMPYQAVARRLGELNLLLSHHLVNRTEVDWLAYIRCSSFPPSPLDQVEPFKKFSHYTTVTQQLVDKKQLSLMEAAQLLTYSDPDGAMRYLDKRQAIIDALEEGDTDE